MSACSNTTDFIIPKGLPFEFTIQVMEETSFLPQILTNFSNGSFQLVDIATGNGVGSPVSLSKIAEAAGSTFYNDNGYLKGTITSGATSALTVARGDAVDGYYPKANYQAVVQVNFSDGTPDKTAILCDVYVVNTGN